MRVLVACEESQEVCKAFRVLGHEAYSNDIIECSGGHPEWHLQMNSVKALVLKEWDLVIAHPPCTYLCNSGVRWLYKKDRSGKSHRVKERWNNLEDALFLFNRFATKSQHCKVAIENPIPHRFARDGFGKDYSEYVQGTGQYSQIIHPYQFGHGEQKATCLWLWNLPKLVPTHIVEGREQRIWKMSPGPNRAKERSKTFPGIAKAMAEQWGGNLNDITQLQTFGI